MSDVDEDDEVLAGSLSLGPLHPLVSTPFAEAVAQPRSFLQSLRERGEQVLDALRPLARQAGMAGEAISIAENSEGVRMVFSEETIAKLQSGEWKIPVDSATGLQRAEVRDGAGRIRETAKFEAQRDKVASAAKVIVALAHVVSSIDTQLQLEKINQKLDALSDFLEADRHGEMRGVYSSLQKALALEDTGARNRALECCSRELDKLQGRYFGTARVKFGGIRHPADINPLLAIVTLQKTAERELKQALTEAASDLRMSEFCSQINAMVHVELGQDELLAVNRRSLLDNYREIAPVATEKLSYLDDQLAETFRTKLALLTPKAGPADFQVSLGELAPAEKGDKSDVD